MNLFLIVCCACGALSFEGQEIAGLWVGPIKPLTNEPATNFHRADLDGDGFQDLLLGREVLFQRNGRYPDAARKRLPDECTGGDVDLWGARLFLKTPDRIQVWKFTGETAEPVTDQAMHWPDSPEGDAAPEANPALRRGRFLYDLDGDGEPEIAAVGKAGLQIYTLKDNRYVPASGVLAVLPSLQLTQRPSQPIWPRNRRALSFPPRQMLCELLLDESGLSILQRQEAAGGVIYHRATWPIRRESGQYLLGETPELWSSQSVPGYVRPCRLNNTAATPGLAGINRTQSTARNLAVDIVETWASLDGGVTKTVRRTPSLPRVQPQAPLVDVNGDGRLDLVIESSDLLDGGGRELVERFMTRSRVVHRVAVYLQQKDGFSDTPDPRVEITLTLGAAPWRNPPMLQRYLAGELVQLTQDVNGDRRLDLVTRTHETVVEVRLARGNTFVAAAAVEMPADATLAVLDVNGDGHADLVFVPAQQANLEQPAKPTQVLFSCGGTP